MKLVFLILISSLFSSVVAEEDKADSKAWKINKSTRSLTYSTNGEIIKGHEFGFTLFYDSCGEKHIWLTLSTFIDGSRKFKKEAIQFHFGISDKLLSEKLNVIIAVDYTPDMKVIAFTNTVADEKFLSFLATGNVLKVGIDKSEDIFSLVTYPAEIFNLNGMAEARNEASKLCWFNRLRVRETKTPTTASLSKY